MENHNEPWRDYTGGLLEDRLNALEENVNSIENLVSDIQTELRRAGGGAVRASRKPISEYKVIQNITPVAFEKCKV